MDNDKALVRARDFLHAIEKATTSAFIAIIPVFDWVMASRDRKGMSADEAAETGRQFYAMVDQAEATVLVLHAMFDNDAVETHLSGLDAMYSEIATGRAAAVEICNIAADILVRLAPRRAPGKKDLWTEFINRLDEPHNALEASLDAIEAYPPVYGELLFRVRKGIGKTPVVPTELWPSSVTKDAEPEEDPVRASAAKLFVGGIPKNTDIVDLVVRLDAAKGGERSDNEIAREFTGESEGSDSKAQSLLSQIRRMRRRGRIAT